MNGLDLALILLVALAAFGGWRLGFMTRAFGWAGAALGLALAVLVVPRVLERLVAVVRVRHPRPGPGGVRR